MKPEDVKAHFKSPYKFRKATDMSENNLYNWLKWGYIPFVSQKRIEKLTNGELVAVWDDVELENKGSKG